jgi:hypothetical protein
VRGARLFGQRSGRGQCTAEGHSGIRVPGGAAELFRGSLHRGSTGSVRGRGVICEVFLLVCCAITVDRNSEHRCLDLTVIKKIWEMVVQLGSRSRLIFGDCSGISQV